MKRDLGNVLVTGGAGFIGSTLVRELLSSTPARVVTLDALTYAGSLSNLRHLPAPERHTFVEGDIRDTELVIRLLREHEVTTLINVAAESHVDRSIAGPAAFLQTNILGTASLLEAARAVWDVRADVRFHQVSTDEVYGDLAADAPPSREGDPYRPSSPYAASKAAADHLVHAWSRTWGLPISISQCTNTFGPHQYPEKLIPVVVRACLEGASIPVYGDGLQQRDWIHVEDHCRALLHIVSRPSLTGSWHISARHAVTNLSLVNQICSIMDGLRPQQAPHAKRITFVADRLGHDRRYALDATALQTATGWRPQRAFAIRLKETIRAMLPEERSS
ncbi:MAG: dTDP-glucose 4,6-dehydratase [Myxococcota bacterium]